MGKWKNPDDKVDQKSICFKKRQIRFMEEHRDFNPHKFCQYAIDEQIKLYPDGDKYIEKAINN